MTIAGVVKGGPGARRAATFSFTAPPAGPLPSLVTAGHDSRIDGGWTVSIAGGQTLD